MIINLIRQRNWPGEKLTIIDTFEFSGTGEPEQALRSAVKEFLASEAGQKAIDYACGDYNWGDAVTTVPDEIWAKHDLKMLTNNKAMDIVVEQDEVLCKED